MNTQLMRMLNDAEGRHLAETELAAIRRWALGMETRVQTTKRMSEREEEIISHAADALIAKQPEQNHDHKELSSQLQALYRHVATASIRDDVEHFQRAHAVWLAEMLTSFGDAEVIYILCEYLAAAVDERLEPEDSATLQPYFQAYLAEVARWR